MASGTSTGYGPRARPIFSGDEDGYELWEAKFLAYMRLQKLQSIITQELPDTDETAEKNADAYAELIQCLDNRSLSLVMRDASDNGNKALKILREHYKSQGKPRIIALYTDLTSLTKRGDESVTDYMLRAETAATHLKATGETISDSLLVAMLLKGLPSDFKQFSTVITQKETAPTFSAFKIALRSYEETEKLWSGGGDSDSVMKMNVRRSGVKTDSKGIKCFTCGKVGHKASECWSKKKKWCSECKSHTHDTAKCRKRSSGKDDSKGPEDDAKAKGDSSKMLEAHSFDILFKATDTIETGDSANSLLVDCGATAHIIRDESKFVNFDNSFVPAHHFIELASGERKSVAQKRGTAVVEIVDADGKNRKAALDNALLVPSYPQDIFSVQAATKKGASVKFSPEKAEMTSADGTLFHIRKKGNLYYLDTKGKEKGNQNMHDAVNATKDLQTWHQVLGHCNVSDIMKLESVVHGMKIANRQRSDCETCIQGKMTDTRNRQPDEKAKVPLELVHCDLAGPVDPIAKDGYRYSLIFVDDYSGLIMVYFLKKKSDTAIATKKFFADVAPLGKVKNMVEVTPISEVKCVRSDNGGEFTSQEFRDLLLDYQVKHQMSSPYSPHQNGTAERAWRSIFEMGRCLLIESGLPRFLWAYAVMASAYIRNRCYNPRLKMTALEAFSGQRPNISNMQVFGSSCYALVQNPKKLEERAEKGVFVGYDRGSPAYLVYFPENQVVKRVRCVKFLDKKFESVNEHVEQQPETVIDADSVGNVPPVGEENVQIEHDVAPVPQGDENEIDDNDDEERPQGRYPIRERGRNADVVGNEGRVAQGRYPPRERARPAYLNDYVAGEELDDEDVDNVNCFDHFYKCVATDVPQSYSEAIKSPDSEKWLEAMKDEMNSLEENETFSLTSLPKGRDAVGGRWVYAKKLGADQKVQYKARYVAKGYAQVPELDYGETFSPTAKMTSIRTLIQLAVEHDLIVHQMDVKTAYLNAPIDCEIYVQQPEGFTEGQNLVYKLKKSLYGLKQSGRNWNAMLSDHLTKELGFKQSLVDNCVFTRNTADEMVVIVIWVDDIIIACKRQSTMDSVKQSLKDRFRMKDLGVISCFLGIDFSRENTGEIKMSQSRYIDKILSRFGLEDCKPRATPCEPGMVKVVNEDTELADAKLYREMVGSLIYIMTGTRPDLCYAVTLLSQYMSKPTVTHLTMAKHAFRYLKGTRELGLVYKKSVDGLNVTGHCDADWASSLADRHSITGYGFRLTGNGPLISWKCKKQKTVALSTCEAEYMSLAAATQEAKFLTQLLSSMCETREFETYVLHCDNQGAIALAKNPVQHQRTKHVDIKYHFVRFEVQNGTMKLLYTPTEENPADVFTKAITRVKFQKFSRKIMGI